MAEVIHVQQRRYPQRQRRQKHFPDMVQYKAVCDSVRIKPVTLKEAVENNECELY
jgi:hypothetical protein